MKLIAARIPDELIARLDKLAKSTGRTKTFYMTEALRTHIEDLEDLYLAEQRMIEVRAGRSKTYTTEELSKNLGLDD